MFPSPTYAGEEVTIELEVNEIRGDRERADLTTLVVRPDEQIGLQGRTLVQLPGGASYPARVASLETTPASSPSRPFKGLRVGQRAETRRTFTEANLDEYAVLTGDANPLYADGRYARRLGLEGRIVPGCLLGGLFSYLLGTRLPGRGTNYLKQRVVYPAPAYPGDALTAVVEIIRLRPEKELVNLRTTCTNTAGETVCVGEALVLARDVEGR
jgi:acyl dehydratase